MSVVEAARRSKVSGQSVGNWKRQSLQAGRTGLAAGESGPSTRKAQLEAEVADLTQALGEADACRCDRRDARPPPTRPGSTPGVSDGPAEGDPSPSGYRRDSLDVLFGGRTS